jgi:hypothetical protein
MRRRFQRNAHIDFSKLQRQPIIHNVVHHPQCSLGYACGKLFNFDAIELIDINLRKELWTDLKLSARSQLAQYFQLKLTELAIGDDKKVAAATGGIEKARSRALRDTYRGVWLCRVCEP